MNRYRLFVLGAVMALAPTLAEQLDEARAENRALAEQIEAQEATIENLQEQRNLLFTELRSRFVLTVDQELSPAIGFRPVRSTETTAERNVADFVRGVLDNGGTQAQADTLMRIADCEWRKWRTEPEKDNSGLNKNGSIDIGAIQINGRVWGHSWATLQPGRDFDADWRTTYWSGWMGVHIIREQGWSAWSASAHCHGVR